MRLFFCLGVSFDCKLKQIEMKKIITLIAISTLILNSHAQWTQLGLDIDGEASGDQSFASSISDDGLTVAIGATRNDGNGSASGHVRVHKFIAGIWTQQGIDIDGEAAVDFLGESVNLSGDGLTLAAGGYRNDGAGGDAGHVRIYKFVAGIWVQQGADIDGEAGGDQSGWSVSLSNDGLTVAIGAPQNDGNGASAGHVRVYKFIAGTWVQQGVDIDGEAGGDQSGYRVSISNDGLTVAISARLNDIITGTFTNDGHVRVYKFIAGAWVQQGADIDGEANGDELGWGLSISGDGFSVAIGAAHNDGNGGNSGHARVYKFITGAWVQQGADIDGDAAGDLIGNSVSLSDNGLVLAVGAHGNDGNGADSGHAKVFRFLGGIWVQQGADIDGEAAGDLAGGSVSLSSDGLTVAVGANRNDGNGTSAGHVRIYSIPAPLPIELISFIGKCNNKYNLLTWQTATEINNDYFTIEKSLDALNWEELTTVNGAGNSSSTLRATV